MNFLKNELNHFKKLTKPAKDLLISYFFYSCANPLINTFLNAFIWRNSHDIVSLALYNAGYTISLPLAFYINGHNLKRYSIKSLYLIGAIITGLIPIIVVFINFNSPWFYLLMGLFFGLGYGIYWSNRNYLTFKQTKSHNRNYFLGLNFSLNMLANITVPLVIGWIIYLLDQYQIVKLAQSYQIIILFGLVFLILSGYKVFSSNYTNPRIKNIILRHITARWQAVRILMLSIGLIEGISLFLPTMLILTHLGAENILGSFSAFISLLSSIAIYYYGRKAKKHHQFITLLTTIIIGTIIALLFSSFFIPIIIAIYLAVNGLVIEFLWLTGGPITMNIMDEEKKIEGQNSYGMVFDQELFLDIGRVVSFAILFLIIYLLGQQIAIRMTPGIVYIVQLMLIFLIKKHLNINLSTSKLAKN